MANPCETLLAEMKSLMRELQSFEKSSVVIEYFVSDSLTIALERPEEGTTTMGRCSNQTYSVSRASYADSDLPVVLSLFHGV